MAEYIEREALIKALESDFNTDWADYASKDYIDGVRDEYDDVLKIICTMPAADHRQLAEWLTELKELRNSIGAVKFKDMKEAVGLLQELNTENDQLTSQLAEAKRLLKAAVEDMYNSVNDVHCKYCSKWHTDQCQGTSHLDCYIENKFKWRYTDDALKLIES